MTDLKDLSVTVSRPRKCHCCGYTLPDDVGGHVGDCPGCFAKREQLANGRIGYRVKAKALLAMPPHETVQ